MLSGEAEGVLDHFDSGGGRRGRVIFFGPRGLGSKGIAMRFI